MYDLLLEHEQAIKAYKEAKQIKIAMHGPDHIDVAMSWNNVGNVYYEQGCYAEALAAHKEAKRIRIAVHGAQHPLVADSWNNMGEVYRVQGCYAEALAAHEGAKRISIAMHGAQHSSVADSWNNVGLIYQAQGRYSEALTALEKAKRIRIAVYGAQHPSVATSWNNVGSIYAEQGQYTKALTALEEAKRIRIAVYGTQHPSVADSWNNVGNVYCEQGHYVEALTVLEEAKRIQLEVYGTQHPSVADSWNNVGNIYCEQGRYVEALAAHEEAKRIKIAVYDAQHPLVADGWSNMGEIYQAQGRYAEALQAHEEAKRIRIAVHGADHIDVATSWNNLGLTYNNLKKFEQARYCFQQAIEIYREFQHPNQKMAENNLKISYIREGNDFIFKGQWEEAKACYQQSDLGLDPMQPKVHQELADSFYRLAYLPDACEHYQILIKLDPKNVSAYHNLGCLTHVRAQLEKEKGQMEHYQAYLKEAESYFQKAIELDAHTGIYTEYAQFMLKNNAYYSFANRIEVLQKAIELKQLDKGLSYGAIERCMLVDYLQQLTDQYKEISIRAYLLAYYLLIQVYLMNQQLQAAEKVLTAFEAEVENFDQAVEANQLQQAQQINEQIILQQQVVGKEQQVVSELLRQVKHKVESIKVANQNQKIEEINSELEEVIRLSLTNLEDQEPKEKIKAVRTSIYFTGSQIAATGDAHDELVKNLRRIIADDEQTFKPFLAAIDERAYIKALIILCSSDDEKTLKLVETLLDYKEKLSININEQAGERKFAAIHYAAERGNQALYELLMQHDADEKLLDRDKFSAFDYMQRHQSANQSNKGLRP